MTDGAPKPINHPTAIYHWNTFINSVLCSTALLIVRLARGVIVHLGLLSISFFS